MRSSTLRLLIPAVLAFGMVSIAVANLMQAEAGITREMRLVDGVPIEIFTPLNVARTGASAVVAAHGFSSSRQLMYGFGYTLARNGYVAALVAFAGHGRATFR